MSLMLTAFHPRSAARVNAASRILALRSVLRAICPSVLVLPDSLELSYIDPGRAKGKGMAHGNGGSAAAGMPARAGSDHWRPGERSPRRDGENARAGRHLEGD